MMGEEGKVIAIARAMLGVYIISVEIIDWKSDFNGVPEGL